MKRCAYLVMEDPGDFVTDYDLSLDAMADLGWRVDCVPWRNPSIDWDQYDAVYICTPWDYPDDPELFLEVLGAVESSSATLINSLPLVQWNLQKTYLRDLEKRGGAVVPSIWYDDLRSQHFNEWFDKLDVDRVVIKPTVGANAEDTYVVEAPVDRRLKSELLQVFDDRPYFIQPFLGNVQSEGEYSLFFFGGQYSHAILKTPRNGDFRSQEEHGAEIKTVTASSDQIEAAEDILGLVDPQPVYVRADFVRDDDGNFLLMELELIEPSLYLRTDPRSSERFAHAFDASYSLAANGGPTGEQ